MTTRVIDLIVEHGHKLWRHNRSGALHKVVFAAPLEVITVSHDESWLGRASVFVLQFTPEAGYAEVT
jgi:hypothetical protein